jgi:hypothetical protein
VGSGEESDGAKGYWNFLKKKLCVAYFISFMFKILIWNSYNSVKLLFIMWCKMSSPSLLSPRYGDDGSSGEENPYTYNYNLKVFTPTEFNKTFSGYHTRQVTALWVYQHFANDLCPRKVGLPDLANIPRNKWSKSSTLSRPNSRMSSKLGLPK